MSKAYSLILAAILATMTQQATAREGGMGLAHREARLNHGHQVRQHAEKRQNFNQTTTRTLANGETIQRNTKQTITDNGFTRNSTMTNSQGQAATKNITVVNDKEAGIHTRTMSGTTFDGKIFSANSTTKKTDEGFSRESSFTNPEGKTGSRSTVAVIDKQAGTMTKTSTINTPNGETKQHSVTHQINQQKQAN